MKSISIVIVSWNCRKFLDECLQSLHHYRHDPEAEIFVVDNASEDGTAELVRDSYPEVVLIRSGENLGFTKANNVGIRRSTGEYVCLINPDVRVLDGCIEKMRVYMEASPRVGLLGPRMLDPEGNTDRSYMGEPSLWNLFCRALALDSLFPQSKLFSGFLMFYFKKDQVADVEILNGWFWMTRRKALDEVGLLDEALFMYGDDLDWSKRFRNAGWRVVYFPEAAAIHYGGGTTARAPIRFSVEMRRANFQYWQKNHGKASQLMYLTIVGMHEVFRLIGYLLFFVLPKSNRSEAGSKLRTSVACLQWLIGMGHRPGVKVQAETR